MQLVQGTRFGALVVARIDRKIRKTGTGAVTESYPDAEITCRCSCGKEITLWESELPKAKWALPQDCSCGAGLPIEPTGGNRVATVPIQSVGRPRGRQRQSVTITLSHENIERMNEVCQQERQTFSRALEEVLELGLQQRELLKIANNS